MKNKPTPFGWQKALATVFGAGLLPIAPGTWGAAVGAVFLLFFQDLEAKKAFWPLLLAVVLLTWIGAKAAKSLEKEWGEDPKRFVLDEFVGVWASVLGHALTWQNVLLAFLLFRFFDILKPLGIRRFEKIGNGWGVMLDDLAAAFWANAALFAINYFLKNGF